jgi:hypothetical protein
MKTPDPHTKMIAQLEHMLLAASKPIPVQEIADSIKRTHEETRELLVEVGHRRAIRFEYAGRDLAVVIADIFSRPPGKKTDE